jgi:hypothetical protein
MKQIIMDSGPIISLALNNLLWALDDVKERYKMRFLITEEVRKEIIDNPLETKKFKLEALQVLRLIRRGVIEEIHDKDIKDQTDFLLHLANTSYKAQGRFMTLVHPAEMTAIAAALKYKADAVMIDERTTRYMIEKPKKLENILKHRLHTQVETNKEALHELRKHTKPVKFIRSAEFVAVAFEKGLFDDLLPEVPDSKKILLDALLWGLKLNGCAISAKDLTTLEREQLKTRKWA